MQYHFMMQLQPLIFIDGQANNDYTYGGETEKFEQTKHIAQNGEGTALDVRPGSFSKRGN